MMGIAQAEAKTVPAEGVIDLRPEQPSAVAIGAETRATTLPGGAEKPSIPYVSCVCENCEMR